MRFFIFLIKPLFLFLNNFLYKSLYKLDGLEDNFLINFFINIENIGPTRIKIQILILIFLEDIKIMSAVTDSNSNPPDSSNANSFNEQFLQILRGVSSQSQQNTNLANPLLLMSQQLVAALASAQHCANNSNSTIVSSPIQEKASKTPKKCKPKASKLKDIIENTVPSTTQHRKKLPVNQEKTEQLPLFKNDSVKNLCQNLDSNCLDENNFDEKNLEKCNNNNMKSEVENKTDLLLDFKCGGQQQLITTMPKESEISERKRPAAIQELLQMKKARLNNNTDKIFFKVFNLN